MPIKRWILHRMNRINGVIGRPDLPRRPARRTATAPQDDVQGQREPTFRSAPEDSDAGAPGPEHLGAYAPLIGAIRDELNHFVAAQLRLHLAIAERDRYLLTSIDVDCEDDSDGADLLRRFTREFTPEQIKRFLAREVIAHLPNASAIDLSQFGGLNAIRDRGESGASENAYAELLQELRSQTPGDRPRSFDVSLVGRWIETDAAAATSHRGSEAGSASPRTPLAGSRMEISIEDGDGSRHMTLAAVVPHRRYVIGKGQDCDIAVNGTFASRRHCEIWVENGVWRAMDTGSTNGIRVESAQGVLGRAGCQVGAANATSAIEIVPGARIVLSALAQGTPADYPRVRLEQGEPRGTSATPLASSASPSATPVTPIAAPRQGASRLMLTATMTSGVRTMPLGEQGVPMRVGRSRSQDLVVDWAHEGVSGHHIDVANCDGTCAEVVVHGDNGVTVDGVTHPAGHRFRWRVGERMSLGRASGEEPECTLLLSGHA